MSESKGTCKVIFSRHVIILNETEIDYCFQNGLFGFKVRKSRKRGVKKVSFTASTVKNIQEVHHRRM